MRVRGRLTRTIVLGYLAVLLLLPVCTVFFRTFEGASGPCSTP